MRNIIFKGVRYLLIGSNDEGAIATSEQYENWETSFAHLFPNGEVKRFNQVIGHKEDITFIDDVIEAGHETSVDKGTKEKS